MNKGLWTMSALALVTGVQGTAAIAQESSGRLEEVLVTAERRSASLQDVPVSVSALSAEGLQNRMVQEAEDLQRFVPSLKMTNNITTPTNLSVSMRGSAVQDASLVVAESPFGIYIDDIYVARMNGNNVTLADIERVEVLRGPQGTLYGRNTVAGAVKFVTRDPGEEGWFNATVGAGNWDQYQASFSGGTKLNDSWAASLSAQITEKDGQFDNVTEGVEVGLERNLAMRGKLRYMGSDTFGAIATVSWSKSNNDALQQPPGTTPGVPGDQVFESDDILPTLGDYNVGTSFMPRQPGMASAPEGEITQLIASLKLSWQLAGGTLESITGYVETDDQWTADFSGLGLIMAATNPTVDQYSQEFKFQSEAMDGKLLYTLGAYFFRETAEQPFAWQFFTPTSNSFIEAETDSIALFGQADYSISDQLTATVGVRWVEDEKDFSIGFEGLPSSILPVPAEDFVELNESYDAVTPRFALNYTFADVGVIDNGMVYGSASSGFKSGGFSGIAIFGLADSRTPYFEETNWTYEMGFKGDMFSDTLRVNANYFMSRTEDAQLNATTNGGASFPIQNAGDVHVDGLEMEITWAPTDGLTLFANAAFMDSEFKNLDPGAAPAQSEIIFNNPNPTPPQTPDYAYTVGFDYRLPLSIGSGSEFMIGANYFSSDEYFVGSTNDFIISPYDRTDGYIGLAYGDDWEFRLSGRNLSDETDIISGSRQLGGFIFLPQREWMVAVTYRP
ncbi:MAG: iron complex outermembrane receptor protein [Halieaceae bacterium]|jgi:iron complex outermembrane receptor protein